MEASLEIYEGHKKFIDPLPLYLSSSDYKNDGTTHLI